MAANKRQISQNELLNAKIELSSLEAEYLDKILQAQSDRNTALAYGHDTESEISKMRNDYANMQIRSSFYQITASGWPCGTSPKSGIGETLKEGRNHLQRYAPPTRNLPVQLCVSTDIPCLAKAKHGSSFERSWTPWFSRLAGHQLRHLRGQVAVIDTYTGGKYRILVTPDPEDHPWPKELRVGWEPMAGRCSRRAHLVRTLASAQWLPLIT